MSGDRSQSLLTRAERRSQRAKILTAIISGTIVIILMFAVAHNYDRGVQSTSVTVNLSDLTETLIQNNSTVYVNPSSYAVYKESLSYNSTLVGAFVSTYPITFYVFNETELLSQNSSGMPNYIYTTGATTGTSVHIYLPSGVYYLEFFNGNASKLANVRVTSPFTITFST
ncbi:MAG: hypothetical protein M1161_04960 [Candidatus Thermoplasmatota archaeon]|nr:hypothetical protein [Candidatus Thermoplasmatota archaeon]